MRPRPPLYLAQFGAKSRVSGDVGSSTPVLDNGQTAVTSISAKSLRPQSSPFFLRKARTRNSGTNDLDQNKMVVPSRQEQMGGAVGEGGGGRE